MMDKADYEVKLVGRYEVSAGRARLPSLHLVVDGGRDKLRTDCGLWGLRAVFVKFPRSESKCKACGRAEGRA